MTQARLADQLGVAVQTISRIEAGKVRVSLARAKALAGALGVPLSAIVAVTEGHTGVDEDPGEALAVADPGKPRVGGRSAGADSRPTGGVGGPLQLAGGDVKLGEQ